MFTILLASFCFIQGSLAVEKKLPSALKQSVNPLSEAGDGGTTTVSFSEYFRLVDTDRNGGIDKKEFKEYTIKTQRAYEKNTADEKMTRCDENEDGYLSLDEYLNCTYQLSVDELVHRVDPKTDDAVRMAKADQIRFDGADQDKDKKLSFRELRKFLFPVNYPEMEDVEIQVGMTRYDEDNDGFVTLNEFLMTGEMTGGNKLDDLNHQFTQLDKNGDKKLTVEELKTWIYPSLSESAERDLEYIFSLYDRDKNEHISFEEFESRTFAMTGYRDLVLSLNVLEEL